MTYLPSLPENATLLHLFKRFPDAARALLPNSHFVMRGPSPLSPGERELIAAYVSALNACDYCYGGHASVAEAFGLDAGVIEKLVGDIDGAPVEDRLKPLFRYVKKLSETPSRMSEADARAVYDAGWDEEGLFSVVQVCCIFNYMNRLVEGLGLVASETQAQMTGELLHDEGYTGVLKKLGIGKD